MKQDIKTKWVAALRSGEYQQITGALCTTDLYRQPNSNEDPKPEFCCLGVLCDLAVREGVEMELTERTHMGRVHTLFQGSDASLPIPVLEWAGLDSNDPEVEAEIWEDGENVSDDYPLSTLNDEYNFDFGTIADLIEGQL